MILAGLAKLSPIASLNFPRLLRAETLRRPSNAATQQVWAESVDRVQALRKLLTDDRADLQPPLTVTVFGARHELR